VERRDEWRLAHAAANCVTSLYLLSRRHNTGNGVEVTPAGPLVSDGDRRKAQHKRAEWCSGRSGKQEHTVLCKEVGVTETGYSNHYTLHSCYRAS